MNEIGPSRPPLPRAAPVLAIGVAVVLAGGLGVAIFVGGKPAPVPTQAEILPPSAPALPAVVPASPPPPEDAPPPARIVAPREPVAVVRPPVVAPARTEAFVPPVPVPEKKPSPPPERAPRGKRPTESTVAIAKSPARAKSTIEASVAVPRRKHAPPKPAGGPWVVQVGAFQSDDHAKLLVDTLAYHGHAARIAGGHDKSGHAWFFVQTPGYATRADAEAVASVLAAREHVPTFVFALPTKPGG